MCQISLSGILGHKSRTVLVTARNRKPSAERSIEKSIVEELEELSETNKLYIIKSSLLIRWSSLWTCSITHNRYAFTPVLLFVMLQTWSFFGGTIYSPVCQPAPLNITDQATTYLTAIVFSAPPSGMAMLPFKIKPNWRPTGPCPLTQLLLPLQQLIVMIMLPNVKISHWTYYYVNLFNLFLHPFGCMHSYSWLMFENGLGALSDLLKWTWCPGKPKAILPGVPPLGPKWSCPLGPIIRGLSRICLSFT